MNRAGSVAYGLAAIALIMLFGRETHDAGLFVVYDHTPQPMFAPALAGWGVTTFGPLILSICIWSLVKRVRARWAPHLLFIPCAIGLYRAGEELLVYASDPCRWCMPFEMFTLLAGLFLMLTLVVHAAALIVELGGIFRRRADAG